MSKIRYGIIGCGNMGSQHEDNMLGQFDNVVLTATVDIDLEKAKGIAEAYRNAIYVTDYREIVDQVDAVLIALPHHLHYECGMFFLSHGKHVLMEKPLANTEDQCLDLIHMAQSKNVVLMTAYVQRYNPIVLKVKELIDKKVVGDCFQLSIWTEQNMRGLNHRWIYQKDLLGGGQLFSHGCHYIDLLLWFLGNPVKGFHMGSNYGTEFMEREGTGHVVIEFESGAMGYHFGTWGAVGSKLKYSMHAHCTAGMIEGDLTNGKVIIHRKYKGDRFPGPEPELVYENSFAGKYTNEENKHFFECIRTGKKPDTDGPQSLQGLRVIWKLYNAEEINQVADLRGLGLNEEWDKKML
jgi:predicted dehydrogenase